MLYYIILSFCLLAKIFLKSLHNGEVTDITKYCALFSREPITLYCALFSRNPFNFIIKLYQAFNTLPLELLHNYQILLFVHAYVYHKEKLPTCIVFSAYFDENKTVQYPNTRQTSDFDICTVHTKLDKE